MNYQLTPTSSISSMYLTSDSQLIYSPLPYIPSQATIEPFPTLPSYTTSTPVMVAPGVVVPSYTTIQPQLPLSPELDLDNDSDTRNKISDYFYYKTVDKWLFDSMAKILGYLKISGNSVDFIDSLSKYDPSSVDKDTQETVEKKIKFIENNILDKIDVFNILNKFTRETNTKWVHLIKKNEMFIKDLIKRFLKKKMEKSVEGKLRSK